ncbi:MAG TPA: prepilin-type N-terminal cleavage/methylation domain-containing protein, partial [bacterium]|nr:prepilin-type N-terminal cleavage/methylation domain-containing protein [bacterium]
MMRLHRILRRSQAGQRGFTVVETVVAMALLGILTISALGGLLFGMTQVHTGQNRAAVASWGQTEM